MIQANCRSRFTAEDFSYIVRTLSQSAESEVSLVELLTDQEARDCILDHDRLRDAVLSGMGHLTISPQLYFYILTRAVLKDTALGDRALADYVASLLTAFSNSSQMESPTGGGVTYLSDLMLALRRANDHQTFQIRAHVGNYSLFISGILHENVRRRCERGAPDVSFYEEMGSASYKVAAEHSVARRCDLTPIYRNLAERFHDVRLALNRLADQFINLGDDTHLPLIS
ncbi:MAG: hypothetical protein ABIT76_14085 [Chthoniobacterales bacterium]